ncbi:hypothetical protein K0B96_08975 [Horticoccus luteus]|uniref:Uncharacterized protein n=1 Tax=Horticoccus luteus TaxID=2862869 RepID=A0A8F9TYT3_9BACT|nr:hypothetical protein [Horticoccus luteus]QYM80713.1 hypothetical protein K0B96_08975 [Horticoccus luteus]
MDPVYYQILHLFCLFVLTAQTFMAFANPLPENRKRTMMITGIAALLVLVSGFGMIAKVYHNHFAGWMVVKLVCWAGLSAMAGFAYRRPQWRAKLAFTALLLVLIALVMVYVKPF